MTPWARLLTCFAALPGCDADAGEAAPQASGSFSLLTYNVHGLPPGITGDDTEARMRAISPLLDAYDVAALQEDFFYSEALLAEIDHPWVATFHETLPGRATHSGLTVASTLRVVEAEGASWETCHGLLEGASDCLGSKGYLRVRLAPDDATGAGIDIYDLHAEAGGGAEDHAARSAQVDQLLAAIGARSAGRAVVVVGDTNLHPDEPLDAALLQRLRDGAGLDDACEASDCPEPDHIDRFLSRSGDGVAVVPAAWKRAAGFSDEAGEPLSDHPALVARYSWETR